MKKIQNIAAIIFIISVVVLAAVSILGVWDVFSTNVITKSYQTLGLLAGVAVVAMIAGHYAGSHDTADNAIPAGPESVAVFTGIRQSTVAVLIVSLALLALLGVMSIWEVLKNDVLHRSLSSIGVVAFSSLIIVSLCLEREQKKIMNQQVSGGFVLLMIVLGWIFLAMIF